jgi:hypothetical protein
LRVGLLALDGPGLGITREQVAAIIVATVFLFIGLAACALAAIRGRRGARLLLWQGIFSARYGARILAQSPAGFSTFPRSAWASHGAVVAVPEKRLILVENG